MRPHGLWLALLLLIGAAGCAPSTPGGQASSPAPSQTETAEAPELEIPAEPPLPPEVIPEKRPERRLVVGVSLLTRAHQFYKELEEAMLQEAAALNMDLKIQSAEFDAAVQLRQTQNLITQRVDALILCPVNSQGSGSAVAEANRAGIPVFTADIASKSGDVVCHIASNNEQGGELVGSFLAQEIGEKGEVAIIDFPTVTSVQERVKGFERALSKYPDIKIVARPAPEEAVQGRAFPLAQDLLQARPNLKGVFGINDDCALAVVQAARATGRDDLVVVGFDATPQAVTYIRNGSVLKADAMQFPRVIGRATINAVARHAAGGSLPAQAPIPTALVRGG